MKGTLRYLAGIAGPNGFGSRSTAEQVTQHCFLPYSHLTAIITGLSSLHFKWMISFEMLGIFKQFLWSRISCVPFDERQVSISSTKIKEPKFCCNTEAHHSSPRISMYSPPNTQERTSQTYFTITFYHYLLVRTTNISFIVCELFCCYFLFFFVNLLLFSNQIFDKVSSNTWEKIICKKHVI